MILMPRCPMNSGLARHETFAGHAFIWWDVEHVRLSPRALALCQDPNNQLVLSVASGNRSLGEGIIQKNGVRRGCTTPADTIFLGSYPLQVGELNGY